MTELEAYRSSQSRQKHQARELGPEGSERRENARAQMLQLIADGVDVVTRRAE